MLSSRDQGYATTLAELWEQCHALGVALPQPDPVAASAMCRARAKVDENVFRSVHAEILKRASRPAAWQWHSDKDLLRSDKRNPCFGRLPEAGGLILGSVQISGGGSPEPFGPWLL